jgi:tetratricopeptide (TPR) repeat protein
MAPVWLLVVATAIVVGLSMKYIGQNQLKKAALGNRSSCEYADVYLASARRRMENIRALAGKTRYEQRELDQASAGLLKGNAELAQAKADLERAAGLCPSNTEANALLAVAEWYLGNPCGALGQKGTALRRKGRFDEAIIQFDLALQQCPDDQAALLGRAICLNQTGRVTEAIAVVADKASELSTTTEGKLIVGRLLAQTERKQEAEQFLKEGLAASPGEIDAIWALNGIMNPEGRTRELADFLFSLGKDGVPMTAQTYHISAGLYQSLNDLPMEERALNEALRIFPNSAALAYDLSLNLYKQDKKSQAREMMKRAIDFDVGIAMQRVKDTGIDPRQ